MKNFTAAGKRFARCSREPHVALVAARGLERGNVGVDVGSAPRKPRRKKRAQRLVNISLRKAVTQSVPALVQWVKGSLRTAIALASPHT